MAEAKAPGNNVESAEHGVGASVSVPDFHRGRLGSGNPRVRIPAYQIPAPADVVPCCGRIGRNWLRQSWPTTYATICGFLLSALFGIPVAMLIAGSKTVESYVYPLLVFSQSVPKIAIAPLFVVWFGFGIIPKIISAFLLGFFPVVVSAVQGFKSVDPDMVDLARAMQGSRFHVFRAVNLPHAMPAIFPA